MKIPRKFNIGDLVQSHYRAKYIGQILDYFWSTHTGKRKQHPIYRIRPLLTEDGRPIRKGEVMHLAQAYLLPAPEKYTKILSKKNESDTIKS